LLRREFVRQDSQLQRLHSDVCVPLGCDMKPSLCRSKITKIFKGAVSLCKHNPWALHNAAITMQHLLSSNIFNSAQKALKLCCYAVSFCLHNAKPFIKPKPHFTASFLNKLLLFKASPKHAFLPVIARDEIFSLQLEIYFF